MSMIDLHNHLLPGIDDGSPDLATSLDLARIAVDEGISHMVCTPHIHPGRYDNSPSTIAPALAAFKKGLADAGIPLTVASAGEVRFGMELMVGVSQGVIPFLGEWEGNKVMLLEFPHGEIPFGAEKLTQWLLSQKITPMIAHPERNKGIMKSPSKLKPFLQQGCLTQVTAQSVAGGFGSQAQSIAEELLEQGCVTILATDAHNAEHRPPVLRPGVHAAAKIVGNQKAAELVQANPRKIAACHFHS